MKPSRFIHSHRGMVNRAKRAHECRLKQTLDE